MKREVLANKGLCFFDKNIFSVIFFEFPRVSFYFWTRLFKDKELYTIKKKEIKKKSLTISFLPDSGGKIIELTKAIYNEF